MTRAGVRNAAVLLMMSMMMMTMSGALVGGCSSGDPASTASTEETVSGGSSPSLVPASSGSSTQPTAEPATTEPATTEPATTEPATTEPATEPVWADEFNEAAGTRPDPSRWAFDIGGSGWGNRQLEYYSDTNASTDGDGHLLITSQPLDVTAAPSCWYGACHFVSSRLTTAGLASWQYGRFEVRAAFPAGEATWPAFWMLGTDVAEVGWPAAGEIDVVENVGRDGGVVRGTAHGPGYSAAKGVTGFGEIEDRDAFHVYAVEWDPTSIVWFIDGQQYHRLDKSGDRDWAFDHEFSLVLNLAIGGALGGDPGPPDYEVKTFAVDYVRVYAP